MVFLEETVKKLFYGNEINNSGGNEFTVRKDDPSKCNDQISKEIWNE